MKQVAFKFKVEGLLSNKDRIEIPIRELFVKINPSIEEIIFSDDYIYIGGNNNNAGKYIFQKLESLGLKITNLENLPTDLIRVNNLIFPLPHNPKFYDIISFFRKDIDAKKEVSKIEEIKKISILEKEKVIFDNPCICRYCYKETTQDLNFCIFCGYEFSQKESMENVSIKIIEIDDSAVKFKLAKYLQDITSYGNYKKLLDSLTYLPTILNFSIYPSKLNTFLNILNEFGVIYNILDPEGFNFDKIIASFKQYGSLDIGTIKLENYYFDPILSKLASDVLKKTSSDSLKLATSHCLIESYRIIDYIKTSDTNSKVLLNDFKNDIEELLTKFLNFIRKANEVNIYLLEKTEDKLNREIILLQNQKLKTENENAKDIYNESIVIKEQESKELIEINKTIEIIQSHIISIATVLSSMRTKITYMDLINVQQNKGDIKELKELKNNIYSRLKAMEEVLSISRLSQ